MVTGHLNYIFLSITFTLAFYQNSGVFICFIKHSKAINIYGKYALKHPVEFNFVWQCFLLPLLHD